MIDADELAAWTRANERAREEYRARPFVGGKPECARDGCRRRTQHRSGVCSWCRGRR